MALRFPGTLVLPSLCTALTLVILHACGSSEDDTPKSCDESQATVQTATFSELYTTVFSPQCGACHGPGTDNGTKGGPDLRTADGFYNGLVGKKGTSDWETFAKNRQSCLPYDFIKPEAADQSIVVAILDETVKLDGCTLKYHRAIPQNICITTPNLAKFKEWINAGAKL